MEYFFSNGVESNIDVSTLDVETQFHASPDALPIAFWTAPPAWGNRHVTATLDFVSPTVVELAFMGNIYPLRRRFDDAGVPGSYGEEIDGHRPYFRVVQGKDVTKQADRDFLIASLTETIARTMVRFNLRTPPAEGDEEGKLFITNLKQIPSLQFMTGAA